MIAGLVGEQPAAQEAMVRLVYGRVRRLARGLCGADADADDVAQQVVIEVLRDAHRFRFEGALEHWVDRITVRCVMRALERERRRRGLLARWLLPGSLPWGTEARASLRDPASIEGVLAKLSPERRQAVLLHHGLGYSVIEMADMLDVPRGTVKDRLVASKRLLRRWLREELEERGWAEECVSRKGGPDD